MVPGCRWNCTGRRCSPATDWIIVGVVRDITQRKQAALELRESERRFSDLLRNVHLASVMLDREARITYCNDYLLRLTGWRMEEVAGRNWFEVFIPSQYSEAPGVSTRCSPTSPRRGIGENQITTRSGERRLIRWNNSVLRSGDGAAIGFPRRSIGEDITWKPDRRRNGSFTSTASIRCSAASTR